MRGGQGVGGRAPPTVLETVLVKSLNPVRYWEGRGIRQAAVHSCII